MKKLFFYIVCFCISIQSNAGDKMTIETLWSLGRVSYIGATNDGNTIYYSVSIPDIKENKSKTTFYAIPLKGGQATKLNENPIQNNIKVDGEADNVQVSPDGKKIIYTREVKVTPMHSKDKYPSLTQANVYVYDDLNQRHWDTWEDGAYSHVFVADNVANRALREIDIMSGTAYDCPQKPHGGSDDLIFTPDSKGILYVTKKISGKAYALSTNTDIYYYDIASGNTQNITEGMMGFDTHPVFSHNGKYVAWLSMEHDGFESDKNDIIIMNWQTKEKINLTADWDETAGGFVWSNDDKKIYFHAPYRGGEHLFEIDLNTHALTQITHGDFNVNGICMQAQQWMVVSRTDMNHATELYTVNLSNGEMNQLTHVNDEIYNGIDMCKVEGRYTSMRNGRKLFSWVIYPPDFDPNKKYPLLLYCQGGPQGALSQFYSFRWNFQLMASMGYIVIAPNRIGMPGWGTAWNADISKDWGGQPMRDYLAAVDDISQEDYIDVERRGAVGASYGGYSVFMLAGIHQGRFKTFISHCGLFDLRSWYGTTEELWFANWDIGGAYWDYDNTDAQHSYRKFSPSEYVANWDTPIMVIQGGKDYRVPIEQGLQAFQAAQLKGIKSRLMYLPEENHWVLKGQNAMIWQTEFFKWLKETL